MDKEPGRVNPQHRDARRQKFRIGIEDADKCPREEQDQGGGHDRKEEVAGNGNPHRLPHPVVELCPVIVADDRLGTLGDPFDRQQDELEEGEEDGHRADGDIAAETAGLVVEADVEEALREAHEKRGRTEDDDLPQDRKPGPQVAGADFQLGPFPEKEGHDPDKGGKLADDRRQGRTLDAHPEGEDEERVQDDVQDAAQHRRHHRRLGKALGGDVIVHPDRQLDKEGADYIGGDIIFRIGQGVFARPEEDEERLPEQEHQDGDGEGGENQHRKAAAEIGLCLRLFSLPDADRGQRRPAPSQ